MLLVFKHRVIFGTGIANSCRVMCSFQRYQLNARSLMMSLILGALLSLDLAPTPTELVDLAPSVLFFVFTTELGGGRLPPAPYDSLQCLVNDSTTRQRLSTLLNSPRRSSSALPWTETPWPPQSTRAGNPSAYRFLLQLLAFLSPPSWVSWFSWGWLRGLTGPPNAKTTSFGAMLLRIFSVSCLLILFKQSRLS